MRHRSTAWFCVTVAVAVHAESPTPADRGFFSAAELLDVLPCNEVSGACTKCDGYGHCKTSPTMQCGTAERNCTRCVGYLGRLFLEYDDPCTSSVHEPKAQVATHKHPADNDLELAIELASDLSGRDPRDSVVPYALILLIFVSTITCWLMAMCCVLRILKRRVYGTPTMQELTSLTTDKDESATEQPSSTGNPGLARREDRHTL